MFVDHPHESLTLKEARAGVRDNLLEWEDDTFPDLLRHSRLDRHV